MNEIKLNEAKRLGKQVCFTAEEELIAELDALAQKTERSRSEIIEMLLKAAVQAWGKGFHEAKAPTNEELVKMIIRLEKRIEKLEEKLHEQV
jgi:metal-responsive CopG/Arc/MetJ family transcriptional regulator